MSSKRYVIIGNGIAGISAAETIRFLDAEGEITIIAREEFPPYSRPMISSVLEGAIGHERLPIRPPDFYDRTGIEALIGHTASSIDVERNAVLTDRGGRVEYDRLLIASGADPRPIKASGLDLGNITFMRTESHVRRVLETLPEVKEALILGGGLVGFKAAYGLMRRGVQVTIAETLRYPLATHFDADACAIVLDELRANGLDVRVEVEAVAFGGGPSSTPPDPLPPMERETGQGNGKVREAHLSDGTSLPCQLVVVSAGVRPALDFVPRDKIKVDLGIVVNEHLQTSAPHVFAAGDVAQAFDVARKETRVQGIWPVAVEQGRVAGANMAGRRVKHSGFMGRNVMRFFGLEVLSGGLVNPPSESRYAIVTRHDPNRKLYRKLVLRDRIPVGLIMVGSIEQGGVILSLAQREIPLSVDPELLLEPHFNAGSLWPAAAYGRSCQQPRSGDPLIPMMQSVP